MVRLIVSLLLFLLFSCGDYYTKKYYFLPKGFKKNIILHFNNPDYPALERKQNGDYHIKVDTSGIVITSTKYEDYWKSSGEILGYQRDYFKWEGKDNFFSGKELEDIGLLEDITYSSTNNIWNRTTYRFKSD